MIDKGPQKSESVLLIEDDDQVIDVIEVALTGANYTVQVAKTARQAFQRIFKSPPGLIILDINLPDLDGFHVAKELKRNMMLRYIPLILLSSRADFLEKMRSLDVVVDEYLAKPFDIQELLLRTQLVLKRGQSNLEANPLTRLPGNHAIVEAIKKQITQDKPFAVGYADLNNFKAYNDKYGFSKGDRVIRLAAKIVVGSVEKLSSQQNFVGHIGGDDFIFICSYDKANEVCQAITETFDKEIPGYYSPEDRDRGTILVEDRRGVVSQFPLVSVAIGLVSDEGKKFSNIGQINHSLTQLKKYAKSFQGSAYVRDRRTLAASLAEFTWGPGSAVGSSRVLENITTALGSYMPGQLTEVIEGKKVNVLFQPILDMYHDEVVGHEALVRGPAGSPLEYPDNLFETARTANKVIELDNLCMQRIVEAAQDFRRGFKLFINTFPETLLDEKKMYESVLKNTFARNLDIIFELSGSHRANDASELFSTLRRMKERGLKICIDASVMLMGQGLRFLPELRPQFIKLNMMNFKEMAKDHAKQEEFVKTVALIRQAGSEVICTKLESRSDSFLAMKMGVSLGQGYLFARPAKPTVVASSHRQKAS